MGQQRPPGAKKMIFFFKNDLGPHGMPKQVFLARFELVVARFGPPTIPKCLENGLFCDQKWVNKRLKNVFFQKMILDHLGAQTSEMSPFQAHVEQIWPLSRPKGPRKWAVLGPQIAQKTGQTHGFRSKPWFSKNDPSPVVVPKRMNTAHFEPLLSRYHPFSIAYLICR